MAASALARAWPASPTRRRRQRAHSANSHAPRLQQPSFPCNKHAEDRNALVNSRQRKVNQDYHRRTRELDGGFDVDPSAGFDAELSSYDNKRRVLGAVVGAFGEISDDVY